MEKTIRVCDICGTDLREETDLNLSGALMEHDPSEPAKNRARLIELEDLCVPCSIEVSEAIDKVIMRRGKNEL